jgi:hypothetical protein
MHALRSLIASLTDEWHDLGYIVATRSWSSQPGETEPPSSLKVDHDANYRDACNAAAIMAYQSVDRHSGKSTQLPISHDANGLPCWIEHKEYQTVFFIQVLEKGLSDNIYASFDDEMDEMNRGFEMMGLDGQLLSERREQCIRRNAVVMWQPELHIKIMDWRNN